MELKIEQIFNVTTGKNSRILLDVGMAVVDGDSIMYFEEQGNMADLTMNCVMDRFDYDAEEGLPPVVFVIVLYNDSGEKRDTLYVLNDFTILTIHEKEGTIALYVDFDDYAHSYVGKSMEMAGG